MRKSIDVQAEMYNALITKGFREHSAFVNSFIAVEFLDWYPSQLDEPHYIILERTYHIYMGFGGTPSSADLMDEIRDIIEAVAIEFNEPVEKFGLY